MNDFQQEIEQGQRFPFGANWQAFLLTLNDARIEEAQRSLKEMLQVNDLKGKSFLDIGCGSGLFSLAARKLGAQVFSFDFDPQSVACAGRLKEIYFPDDKGWKIERGSALDGDYLERLGNFDVVYSWGVLHHTGEMWKALENACRPTKKGGKLFIALYNDQGLLSRFWWCVKKTYCSGRLGKAVVSLIFIPYFAARAVLKSILTGTNAWTDYKRQNRGMSLWHDWIDWLGGFPFEVAGVKAVEDFYRPKGFQLSKLKTTRSLGCNEFVLTRN